MAESFLSSLLSKASSLSQQKLSKGTTLQTTARVYKATDKPLSEPKYVPKKTNSIDSLLQQAKDYGTNKPQQVNPAAGYLTSLYSENLNTVQQAVKGVTKEERKKYNKTAEYRNILSTQATQLQALNSTQESLFGVGFSGVDAQTLQAANWTGVMGLQAEIEKNKKLRDVYAEKYAAEPTQSNLDYIKSYSNLIYDTSKNMVDETTRTLIAAKKNAAINDQTKQSTIAALEKYNTVLGGTANKEVKQPTDVNTNVSAMKQQIIARTNQVSGYLEKVQSTPKFEELRPL